MKKVLTVLIMFLLTSSTFSLFTPQLKARGGTIVVPDDYPTIQEAINAASPGSTIYVKAGIYYESLSIRKPLTLFGENKDNTIIDGRHLDHVVRIEYTNDVTISGFTIQRSGKLGIKLYDVSKIKIIDNKIWRCWYAGIRLDDAVKVDITQNILIANLWGIEVGCYCLNNVISNNLIKSNSVGIVLGARCYYNTISGNEISKNGLGIGFYGYPCEQNLFTENIIMENNGGVLFYSYISSNIFFHNDFVNNYGYQVKLYPHCKNVWDAGYPSGGNYWSDHECADEYSGLNQDQPGSDGICDKPYVIDENNVDRYPLMSPFSPIRRVLLPIPYFYQGDTNWCGPNSLAMILKYYYGSGRSIHSWDIAEDLKMGHDNGFWFGPEWFEWLPRILHNPPLSEVKEYVESNYPELDVEYDEWGLEASGSLKSYILESLDQKIPIMLVIRKLKHIVVITGYKEMGSDLIFYVSDPSGILFKDLKDRKVITDYDLIGGSVKWNHIVDFYLEDKVCTFVVSGEPKEPVEGTLYIIDYDVKARHPDGSTTDLYLWEGLKWIKGLIPIINYPIEGNIYNHDYLSVLVRIANFEEETNDYLVKGQINSPTGEILEDLQAPNDGQVSVPGQESNWPILFSDVSLEDETKFPVGDGYSIVVSLFNVEGEVYDRITIPFAISKTITGTIAQGGTKTHAVRVSSGQAAIEISLNWTGSDLDLEVIDPTGKKYTGTRLLRTQEKLVILNPTPGEWTINVVGTIVLESEEEYTLAIRGFKQIAETKKIESDLNDLKAIINTLSDEVFKNNPNQRKNALCNKIDEVIEKINAEEYDDAIRKLLHDIREKLNVDSESSWVVDDLSDIIGIIDRITTNILLVAT